MFIRLAIVLGLLVILMAGCGPVNSGDEATASPNPALPTASQALPVLVYVEEEGFYQIDQADVESFGIRLSPGNDIYLYNLGEEQPFWLADDASQPGIRFFGRASNSLYSKENVYWLVQGEASRQAVQAYWNASPSTRLASVTPDQREPGERVGAPPGSVVAHRRLEQNLVYQPLASQGDHWLWLSLPAPSERSLEIDLDSPAEGPSMLRLGMWASTENPLSPDHHLRVALNEMPIADETWDGIGRYVLEAEIPARVLKDGANRLIVTAPGDTGAAADMTFIDWIEFDYARLPLAIDDVLDFWHPGGTIELEGFSGDVEVYEITDRSNPREIKIAPSGARKSVAFQGEKGRHYVAVGPQGYRRVARLVSAFVQTDLQDPASSWDYLAIGPPDLLAALEPLLAYRRGSGLKVLAVPLQSVYDQFNYGMAEPDAIQNFMLFASQTWARQPRYLLLVGDASYDPRAYQAPPEANRLPTFLVDTIYGGQTASDVLFGQVEGTTKAEGEPVFLEVAIGRIPARTPKEVKILVDKMLLYERSSRISGQSPGIMAIADGQGQFFKSDAQSFLDLFSVDFRTELYAPPAGASTASQSIREYLEADYTLVAYFGHGSIETWGKDRLFSTADVLQLSSPRILPVVLNMTCLTGLFTHPSILSLAEALLWQPAAGAVAVLAPTSLTLPGDQSFLSRPLAQVMIDHPEYSLGEALMAARQMVPTKNPGTRDVLLTFLLFGDPALQLAGNLP